MNSSRIITKPYQVYEGRPAPGEFIEGAYYIFLPKRGSWCFCKGGTYPKCDISKTIGPIYIEESIPDRPPRLSTWSCLLRIPDREPEWVRGVVINGELVDECGNIADFCPTTFYDLAYFDCERFDEIPNKLREAIRKAKQE